ncbi:MAG: bacteriohopanetetrol glucosamine biosynthesis glycosyltransferase HpnI [Acidobacteriaceae bacterium]
MLLYLLFAVACLGTISSSVFLALALAGVRNARSQWARSSMSTQAFAPPVTLLKPMHGMEPQLERNLESFFDQNYDGEFEIIFCAKDETDAALQLAKEVSRHFPNVHARFLVAGETAFKSAKVWSLHQMAAVAHHDLLIISDSDVEVKSDYISSVVAPFAVGKVGCVTCLYRGKPTGGIWSQLEGLGMSVEMTSGVLIANLLEGMKFALGPTMVVRREALNQIGGFQACADYASDDFVLGNWIADNEWTVVLSPHVIDHVIQNRTFFDSMRHQVRWMRSTRFSRPKGHFGTGFTFAMPFGILAAITATAMHHANWGIWLLAWAVLNRMLQSACIGWVVVRDSRALVWAWLYPVRDLMGFLFWLASYASSEILWRGQTYTLTRGGKMVEESADLHAGGANAD